MKEVKKYDFVSIEGISNYYFIYDIHNDVATVIGMKVTESGDSIMFYSRFVNMNKLKQVDESYININGPLFILRDNMKNGVNDCYIEGLLHERI